MTDSPFSPAAAGVRVAVRLTPTASRDRVEGVRAEAGGGAVLRVSVTAVPEDGKANAALIKLLAKQWKLPKTSIDVIAGATDRRKTLLISGNAAELRHRLEQWITDHE
jgi:uncharacterized protein (TIGR00251 family)